MTEDLEITKTPTGNIFVDRAKKLEFLSVGDYGKENNIKANFLGLTKEIHGVKHETVDLRDKYVATISTQKGCPMQCTFCDCPSIGFHGNVSVDELSYQIQTIMEYNKVFETKRFNVHFARMGEPTFNENVLTYAELFLQRQVVEVMKAETIHPVLSTMLPRTVKGLQGYLLRWCYIKDEIYKGEAGLQLSINTTNDEQRNAQFRDCSLNLEDISKLARTLPDPLGRKYTLNFAVTEDTILDPIRLTQLFDPKRWIVKITPIHKTTRAVQAGYDVTTTYEDYNVYRTFEDLLLEMGWDVIVFVPSEEEDLGRITCGNTLLAEKEEE